MYRREGGEDLANELNQTRQAVLDAPEAAVRGDLPERVLRGGVQMTPPCYFVRRVAWHVLDHAWEIEIGSVLATEPTVEICGILRSTRPAEATRQLSTQFQFAKEGNPNDRRPTLKRGVVAQRMVGCFSVALLVSVPDWASPGYNTRRS